MRKVGSRNQDRAPFLHLECLHYSYPTNDLLVVRRMAAFMTSYTMQSFSNFTLLKRSVRCSASVHLGFVSLQSLQSHNPQFTLPYSAFTLCRAQKVVKLPAFKRGCHVVTSRITDSVPELAEFDIGMANLFSKCVASVKLILFRQCIRIYCNNPTSGAPL